MTHDPTTPPSTEPPQGVGEPASDADAGSTGEAWVVPPVGQRYTAPEGGPSQAAASQGGQFAAGPATASSPRTGRWSRIRGAARRRRTAVVGVGGVIVGAAAGAVIATAAVEDSHPSFDRRGDGQFHAGPGAGSDPTPAPSPSDGRGFDHGHGEH